MSAVPGPQQGQAVVALEAAGTSADASAATAHSSASLTALLESAMAAAARSRMNGTRGVAAVDLHVVFVRPATGRLVATARTLGGGRSLCFCEARAEDAQGRIAAQATATFRYQDAPGA